MPMSDGGSRDVSKPGLAGKEIGSLCHTGGVTGEPDARDFSQYMLPQNKPRSAILTREVDFRTGFEEARHILCTSFTCMPRRCCLNTSVGAAPLSKEVHEFRSRRPLPLLLDPALILPLPSPYNALPKWHLFLRFDASRICMRLCVCVCVCLFVCLSLSVCFISC